MMSQEERAYVQQLENTIEELRGIIAMQAKTIANQAEQIAELTRRLNMNSTNSSKPSSTNGFKKKTRSLRQPSGISTWYNTREGTREYTVADGREVFMMLTIQGIKDLIKPVCDGYPINKVYLFGSYSRGDAKESSDVDLRIEGDIKSFLELGGVYEDLREALGKELDLLSVLPDSQKFRENLKRDEILIYER